VDQFTFKPLKPLGQVSHAEHGGGFTPMAIFDPTELRGGDSGEPSGPPALTLTEEELQHQLREAFENGLAEGKGLAERGLVHVFRSLRSAAEEVEMLREKVLRESEDELVRLIVMVARKVVLREIAQDRSILSDVVHAAVAAISEQDEITVRLNPDDYALITTGQGDLLRQELITNKMHLKPDPAVMPGSCQVDSELGTVDAGIDAQLDEIMRSLQEARSVVSGSGS